METVEITVSAEAARYLRALVEVDMGENAPSQEVYAELLSGLP